MIITTPDPSSKLKNQDLPIISTIIPRLLTEVNTARTLGLERGEILSADLIYSQNANQLLAAYCRSIKLPHSSHEIYIAPILAAYGSGDTYARAVFSKEVLERFKNYFDRTHDNSSTKIDPKLFLTSTLDNAGRHSGVMWKDGEKPGRNPYVIGLVYIFEATLDQGNSRALVIGVADEGKGISDPRRCAVEDYTSVGGQGCGFGFGLKSADFSLVSSRDRELFLFDSTNLNSLKEPDDIDRVAAKKIEGITLPAPDPIYPGCSNIGIFLNQETHISSEDLAAKFKS